MSWSSDFPRLTPANHLITSPATATYNCVAWAAGDTEHWWQPGNYWLPADWPEDDFGLGALEQVFRALGYENCDMNATLELGFTKVAVYGYGFLYTHAARQLSDGKWTSKLGKGDDIEHDSPDDVAGGLYGEVQEIMKRPVPAAVGS
jgi:hypothetical protein